MKGKLCQKRILTLVGTRLGVAYELTLDGQKFCDRVRPFSPRYLSRTWTYLVKMLILSLGERPHTVRAPEHCTHDLTDEPKTQPHTFISKNLDEEKNGYEAIDQLLYICTIVKGWTHARSH